ncbi:MAG: hypothetical protein KKD28_12100, partial [Chloroflexi bacterium]|nr:hypothetical protein [Chloroflexota bacterium]
AIGVSVYNTAASPMDEPVTATYPYSTLAAPAPPVDTPPTEVQASVNSDMQYTASNNGTPANATVADTTQNLSSGAIPSDDSTTALSQPSTDKLPDTVGNDSQGNGNGNSQGNTGNGNGQGNTGNGNGHGQGNTDNGKGGGGGGNGNGGGIGRSGNSSGSE